MMWYIISTIAYGMLSALDPLLFIYIAYSLNVNGVYLGILSTMWSIAYIIANKALDAFADRGSNRMLCALTLLCVFLITYFFNNINFVIGFLLYILHAVAIASLNLAISVTTLESFDSDSWNRMTLYNKVISNIARGSTLIIASMLSVASIINLFYVVLLNIAITAILMPSLVIAFERRFFKLNKTLDRIGYYIKASSSLLYIDRPKTAMEIFARFWDSVENISPIRVLISITGGVAVGDYVFTIVPLVVKSKIVVTDMWKVYGIAAIISALISFLLRNADFSSRIFAFTVSLLRLAILTIGFGLISNVLYLLLYIVITSTLFMMLDITLYNIYISTQAGYGTSAYFIFREIGSVIGSLIGGFAIGLGQHTFLSIAIAIGLATAIPLVL
ncbi:MAG: hypothetical protein QW632_00885 [Ignisphaera sp.]